MEIDYYRKLKNVERLSRIPTHRSYNVLEHSYMVAVLFKHFASKEDVAYNMSVFESILHHDIVESVTGDLPHDVKNHNQATASSWREIELRVIHDNHPGLVPYLGHNLEKALTLRQYCLFKACDLLDLWIFLKEEQGLGNTHWGVQYIIYKCEQLIERGQFPHLDKYMDSYSFENKVEKQGHKL